jgi:hypothetical protein
MADDSATTKQKDDLQAQANNLPKANVAEEVAKSDEFAETLHSLENLIEAKASKLMQIKQEMKKRREMLKGVFENDPQLSEASEKKQEVYQSWRQRKKELRETPEVKDIKQTLKEMRDARKDIEESLSNHLINYHQLTNSTSFDTSDGDQWEFKIKAKVKNRKV